MPQACQELTDWAYEQFGGIGNEGPEALLTAAGYVLTPRFAWKPKPGVKFYDGMTQAEYMALAFLVQEWDYAGLELTS